MQPARRTWNIRRPLVIGLGSLCLLMGAMGVWAVTVNIGGAVIGSGSLEVSSTFTAVQHPIGGVVARILAREGDLVQAGDVVLRLDDWQLQSDLKVVEGDLYETLASIARIEAVLDGQRQMALDPVLIEVAARPDIAKLITRQEHELDAFYSATAAEEGLLEEQITQTEAQIAGLDAQMAAKRDELDLIAQELTQAQDLNARGLNKLSELLALQKAEVGARGETGRLMASMAELRGKISELQLRRQKVVPDATNLLAQELNKLRPERTRHLESRASLQDSLRKLDIRAPVSGKIYQSKVLGVQSVVTAASPLMMIVPAEDPVQAKVRIFATDIDQAYVGQETSLRFRAFNGRQLPIILGRVTQISADALLDQVTQKTYYEVKIALLPDQLALLGDKTLIPGMPVDAYLSTESRTPISYVLRPFMVYFDRAFRDS